eukprot:2900171-Amphidinium_carterae.2
MDASESQRAGNGTRVTSNYQSVRHFAATLAVVSNTALSELSTDHKSEVRDAGTERLRHSMTRKCGTTAL